MFYGITRTMIQRQIPSKLGWILIGAFLMCSPLGYCEPPGANIAIANLTKIETQPNQRYQSEIKFDTAHGGDLVLILNASDGIELVGELQQWEFNLDQIAPQVTLDFYLRSTQIEHFTFTAMITQNGTMLARTMGIAVFPVGYEPPSKKQRPSIIRMPAQEEIF